MSTSPTEHPETTGTAEPAAATSSSRALRWAWLGVAVVAVALAGLLFGTGFDLGRLTGGGDDEVDPLAGIDDIDWSTGMVVASDDHDGVGADMVLALGSADTRCVGVRTSPDAEPTPVRCSVDGHINLWDDPEAEIRVVSDHFGFFDTLPVRGDGTEDSGWSVVLAGAVSPETVRVTLHLGDGDQYSFVTRNVGGWFVAVLPDAVADIDGTTGRLVNAPVALDLYDDEGNRITVIDLTEPPSVL